MSEPNEELAKALFALWISTSAKIAAVIAPDHDSDALADAARTTWEEIGVDQKRVFFDAAGKLADKAYLAFPELTAYSAALRAAAVIEEAHENNNKGYYTNSAQGLGVAEQWRELAATIAAHPMTICRPPAPEPDNNRR